jgi:hypothetical protein
MQHIELLSGILAGEQHDSVLSSGVVIHELGHIIDLVKQDHPAIVFFVMLGYIFLGESFSTLLSGLFLF